LGRRFELLDERSETRRHRLRYSVVLDPKPSSNCQQPRSLILALHVLAYNLTRVMNIIGIQPLMVAMRA
jgi:hypothetical protein